MCLPGLGGCGPSGTDQAQSAARPIDGISPIDRAVPETGPAQYSGDNPGRAHQILWNKQAYLADKGGLPDPGETVPLVIVGGGISGLTSAWRLRRHQPVVLERAPRFGGNSRGESWQGVDYSIGAAYVLKPATGTPIDALFRELGLAQLCREHDTPDPVLFDATDNETEPALERRALRFTEVYLGKVSVSDFRKNARGELGTRTATLHAEGIAKLRKNWIYRS